MELIDTNNRAMTPGEWLLTVFITGLPIVGLVFLFIWAFGDGQRPERVNFAKAYLLFMLIGLVLASFILMVWGAAFLTYFSQMNG